MKYYALPLSSVLPHGAFVDLTDANTDACLNTAFTDGSDKHPKAGPNIGTRWWEFIKLLSLYLALPPVQGVGRGEV